MGESEKRPSLLSHFAQAMNTAGRFETDSFALNVLSTGSGIGQISRNPECEKYERGQVVSLTAIANADSKFIGWSGDATGSYKVCNSRMNDAKSVIANFERLGNKSQNVLVANSVSEKRVGYMDFFIDHGDGTVIDRRSGLMWMRPSVGQNWVNGTCTGTAKLFSLSDAIQITSDFAGYFDWRLPTIEELQALIYPSRSPALDEEAFPSQSGSYFWSSSLNTFDDRGELRERTMVIALRSGVLGYSKVPADPEHIRLVRENIASNASLSAPADQRNLISTFEVQPTITKFDFLGVTSQILFNGEENSTSGSTVMGIENFDHFSDHDDGTATDTRTGLMWMRAAVGQSWSGYTCIGQPRPIGLTAARAIASGVAGHFDWRLPSVAELTSLIYRNSDRDFGNLVFPNQSGVGSYFWTDSGQKINPNLKNGTRSDFKDKNPYGFVRLVRTDNQLAIVTDTIGTGNGTIFRSLVSDNYPYGVEVTLTARANVGSKFKCWHGDASGRSVKCKVTMDSAKEVSAEFVALESFPLDVTTTGTGSGSIDRSIDSPSYSDGTEVTLTAQAEEGSVFNGWNGDVIMMDKAIVVTMSSAFSIRAEFVALETFLLDVTATGTGSGSIVRSIDSPKYFAGTEVTLSALAENGSIFNGWRGDVTGLDDACTVTMDSVFTITAEFEKVSIADTAITVELVSTTRSEVKRGQFATVFNLMLRNKSDQQIHIKVPMTSYVSQTGQTSEQSSWAAGSVNGSKGVGLAAGTFCEMGLAHFNRPAKGDRLFVNVEQAQPFARTSFTFQCIDRWDAFLLINASLESAGEAAGSKVAIPAMASVLKRIDWLERTLAEVLRKLDAMQSGYRPAIGEVPNNVIPSQTLPEVLAWLCTQTTVQTSDLRLKLLPLDLLPSAVIADINERSYDLAGEAALNDSGDAVCVQRGVLLQVLAAWGE